MGIFTEVSINCFHSARWKVKRCRTSNFQNTTIGTDPRRSFATWNGVISLATIERWCKMIQTDGSINLRKSPGRTRTIRTKAGIQKVKVRVNRLKEVSSRKLARELGISRTSVQRVLCDDLGLRAYKVQIEPLLTDEHKETRIRLANWIRTNFCEEDTMKILFSDEKMFDIDRVYNSQNERIWAVDRAEANTRGGIRQRRKFPQKVMLWLAVCSKGVSPVVIFEKGTVDHDRYIKEVLPIALKYGSKDFGNDWTFQQDEATPHTHEKSQAWCAERFHHLPSRIDGLQIVLISTLWTTACGTNSCKRSTGVEWHLKRHS